MTPSGAVAAPKLGTLLEKAPRLETARTVYRDRPSKISPPTVETFTETTNMDAFEWAGGVGSQLLTIATPTLQDLVRGQAQKLGLLPKPAPAAPATPVPTPQANPQAPLQANAPTPTGLGTGAIVGIVLGAAALVGVLVFAATR